MNFMCRDIAGWLGESPVSNSEATRKSLAIRQAREYRFRHKLATSPNGLIQRMADFCGLLWVANLWRELSISTVTENNCQLSH